MIIAVYSKFDVDRLLKFCNLVLMALIPLLICCELVLLKFYPWENRFDSEEASMASALTYSPFPYESIGTGTLRLNAHQTWGWMSNLAKDLLVIAYNSRPDVSQGEAQVVLGLKSSDHPKQVVSGKVLFLEKDESSGAFAFSDAAQPFWIKPILLENGRVLIEAGNKLGQLESSHGYEEKGQFVVPALGGSSHLEAKRSVLSQEALNQLKYAKCWGKDLLIEQYGGREFAKWKEKFKIDFSQSSIPYVCYVAAGDYLLWKDGKWREGSFSEISPDQPVVLVKSASARSIELAAWDESGFYPMAVELPVESLSRPNQKPESTLTQPRLRTASQVSCMLGKKRVVLRQGDWMLKTATGWRNLRRKEEIESCLQHQIKGELFIFDALDKEQGRWVLKGTFFDEMRTQASVVSVQIEAEGKPGKNRKKRRIPFAPREGRNG